MNRISAHINSEVIKFNLGESTTEFTDTEYRQLQIGENLDVFMTTDQAEALFDTLDKKLHKLTYSDLQDNCFNLDDDLRVSNELIEMYQDN